MKNFKKIFALILVAAMAFALLTACGDSKKEAGSGDAGEGFTRKTAEGTLTVGYLAGLQGTFDMISGDNYTERSLVYDTLFTYNPVTLELENLLADSYEYLDDTHLKITLKDNAVFSNGEPVTSEDVLFSLERIITEQANCVDLALWIDFENCSIESDKVFTIATYEPFPAGIYMLSTPTWACILPKAFCETATAEDFWSNPVGSGPYKVVSNTDGVNAVFELRDDYWNKDNLVTDAKTIEIKYYTSNQTMMLDYEEGILDVCINADTSEYQRVQEGTLTDTVCDLKIVNDAVSLVLPDQNEKFTPKVREAISLALDTQLICDITWGGTAIPATSTFASTVTYYKNQGDHVYDPEKAKALMEEEGYSDSNKLVLTISGDPSDETVRIFTTMQQLLEAVHIDLQTSNEDIGAVIEKIVTGGMDMMVYPGSGLGSNHPYEVLMSTLKTGNPIQAIMNEEYNEIASKAVAEMDPDKAAELYGQCQDWIVGNYAYIPIAEKTRVLLYRPYVTSFSTGGDQENVTFRYITME